MTSTPTQTDSFNRLKPSDKLGKDVEEQQTQVFLRDKHQNDRLGHARGGSGRPVTASEGVSESLQRRKRVRLNPFCHFYHEACRWRADGDTSMIA